MRSSARLPQAHFQSVPAGGWRVSLLLLTFFGAVACGGTTSGPSVDAGLRMDAGLLVTPDAGLDAGAPADGGVAPDGGVDGGAAVSCAPSGCAQVAGTYQLCFRCPAPIGVRGPSTLIVTQEGCAFRGCEVVGGQPNQNCLEGCLADGGAISGAITLSGLTVQCEGAYADGGAELSCNAGAFGICRLGMTSATISTCQ